MKLITGSILLVLLTQSGIAQFYYKDLVVTGQTAGRWQAYKENKIKAVELRAFNGDGRPTDGFTGEQEVSLDFSHITTHTKATGTSESWLITSYSASGNPLKTMDTSDTYRSVSDYQYDAAGRLTAITNTSIETDNQAKEVEQHLWQYDQQGKPTTMIKIRNGNDSTLVRFIKDEKGNISEEHATRNKTDLPTVYYYYDESNRLTDIVRYNARAQRLLPDYIFEYASVKDPITMLVVPEGSNDYQKWLYEYNDKGLKVKEVCYNKQKELVGRVDYQYITR